ncbi:MAG: PQQ-binding-like beta-propeller repeat protein [Acidimicrobiales bacterium]
MQIWGRSPRGIVAVALVAAAVGGVLAGCGSGAPADPTASVGQSATCDWPMAGQVLARTHATTCRSAGAIGKGTLGRLEQVWFTPTRAEVTGAPAVVGGSLYLGDWSGRVYALRRSDGTERWHRDLPRHPPVYAGQIPASPTVTSIDGHRVLVVASGRTVWALDAADGEPRWRHTFGDPTDPNDPIEIEGSPAVAAGKVLVPTDVHNEQHHRSGLVALSLATGEPEWTFDPEAGHAAAGCGSIWGSPSVDLARHLVVVGTGSCFHQPGWTRYSEAIVGVDLRTGEPQWSYQPRRSLNSRDWDFSGAPNLYEIGEVPVAGLGNKDGTYYVVDRTSGDLIWKSAAVKASSANDGFAFGGFIGATSVAADSSGRAVVAGGTAVGDCPCQHGFDAGTGEPLWQSPRSGGTYGASAASGGVVFTAGIDQTLRGYDLADGKVLWSHKLDSISASGPAIAGDLLAIGVGFREPGSPGTPSGGVQAFRVLRQGEAAPTTTSTTLPEGPAVTALRPSDQACVGAPCTLDFTLKDPPAGRSPKVTLEITPSPLRIRVVAKGLGPPSAWLGPDGPASAKGASAYAVFITPRDDKPELGSIVCVLDDAGTCTGDQIDLPADGYTRLSLLALADAATPPTLQEGYDRLVTTHSLDPALVPA